jgi:ferredoxin
VHRIDNPLREGGGRGLKAVVDEDICIGCGVCVPRCRKDALSMVPRDQRVFVPETTVRRLAIQALERGKLQDMLLDADGPLPTRATTAFLSTIAGLPPVKQRVARSQLRSHFVEVMIDVMKGTPLKWLSRI